MTNMKVLNKRNLFWFVIFGLPLIATIVGYLVPNPLFPDKQQLRNFLDNYGEVTVQLKKGIRKRTTFTDADSLDMNVGYARVTPSLIDSPSMYSSYTVSQFEDVLGYVKDVNFGPVGEMSTYFEAQIHGGVTTSNIEKVIFQKKAPTKKIIKVLKDSGINWEVQ